MNISNNKKYVPQENQIKKNLDKYGVSFDSAEYLDRASVASASDHTGIVPVAMVKDENKKSYEAMFNVPVGNISDKDNKNDKNDKDSKNNKNGKPVNNKGCCCRNKK